MATENRDARTGRDRSTADVGYANERAGAPPRRSFAERANDGGAHE